MTTKNPILRAFRSAVTAQTGVNYKKIPKMSETDARALGMGQMLVFHEDGNLGKRRLFGKNNKPGKSHLGCKHLFALVCD